MASEPGSAERCAGTQARSFPWTLSAGDSYVVLSSTPGKASPIFRTVSKSIALLGTGQHDSEELTDPLWPNIGMNRPPRVDVAVIIPESRNPFKASPDRSDDPTCAFG